MITFPISKVNALRVRAVKVCPEPNAAPEGWSKSTVAPMKLLGIFESLQTKVGIVLRAYQFRAGGNGNGIIWAMPETASFPSPDECSRVTDRFLEPPKPPQALDELMDAIEGDGSPWSYLSASIFAREAAEFGAMWHGCNWSTHTIIGADPWQRGSMAKGRRKRQPLVMTEYDKWNWKEPEPKVWKPSFDKTGEIASISFLTYSGLGNEALCRFTDTYRKGCYKFETEETIVAEGLSGYVF